MRNKQTEHCLEKHSDGWTCSICQWRWKSKPQTLCPGIIRYEWWHNVPEHLKTKTQLNKIGLKPANEDEPEGCILMKATGYYWLYDARTAIHKKKPTPAQRAALAKARALLDESIRLANERRGVLEPYRDGLIEVRPYDGDDDDVKRYRWTLTGVHLPDGDAYQASVGRFSTHIAAVEYGKTVIDWILANSKKITYWGCYTGDRKDGGLGITLHRKQREYPACGLPYLRSEFHGEVPKLEVMLMYGSGKEAMAAGWAEAVDLPYVLNWDGSLVVVDSSDEAVEAGWIPAWSIEERWL